MHFATETSFQTVVLALYASKIAEVCTPFASTAPSACVYVTHTSVRRSLHAAVRHWGPVYAERVSRLQRPRELARSTLLCKGASYDVYQKDGDGGKERRWAVTCIA